jgi:hypothetical protein
MADNERSVRQSCAQPLCGVAQCGGDSKRETQQISTKSKIRNEGKREERKSTSAPLPNGAQDRATRRHAADAPAGGEDGDGPFELCRHSNQPLK